MELFRELSPKEETKFKQWARDNWKVEQPISDIWHPTVVKECAIMLEEHIRKNICKYDSGTLDWNFKYKNSTIALSLLEPLEDLSEEEQLEMQEKEHFEMAVEHFWEEKWEELTNGES